MLLSSDIFLGLGAHMFMIKSIVVPAIATAMVLAGVATMSVTGCGGGSGGSAGGGSPGMGGSTGTGGSSSAGCDACTKTDACIMAETGQAGAYAATCNSAAASTKQTLITICQMTTALEGMKADAPAACK